MFSWYLLWNRNQFFTMDSWSCASFLSWPTSDRSSLRWMTPSPMLLAKISASFMFLWRTSSGLSSSAVSSRCSLLVRCVGLCACKSPQFGKDFKNLKFVTNYWSMPDHPRHLPFWKQTKLSVGQVGMEPKHSLYKTRETQFLLEKYETPNLIVNFMVKVDEPVYIIILQPSWAENTLVLWIRLHYSSVSRLANLPIIWQ